MATDIATTNAYSKYINSIGTHYISNSGHDENGKYNGGKAGDQTGDEWALRSWYSRPWSCVLRYEKDSRVGLCLANLGCAAALNNLVGYDQGERLTYYNHLKASNWDPRQITIACEDDCSAGVAANVIATGYLLGISSLQKISNSLTTFVMRGALKSAGFTVLTDSKYISGYSYLLPGDILLYDNGHVCTNITKGSKANSSITSSSTASTPPISSSTSLLKKGSTGQAIKDLQTKLNKVGNYGLAVDGDFGTLTETAVKNFQMKSHIEVDGIVGPTTLSFLNTAVEKLSATISSSNLKNPYMVKITAFTLNIRSNAGTQYPIVGVIKDQGTYTIIEEKNGWGKLKSGAGWISLEYAKKV